ncbi:4'-phosphopantetheinyl transferase superfamily protein [Curtobacterium sp. MCSS17_007]|uniref:4'-phosphopantetheinyl transferase superfamily protein n=1 Tax=Curtobacterium sp. MCSS17_007 TaxID=2175646 RepID=UPI000DA82406|nr:4'-phosphopantetheinyl transferase superfamily protein [Curtobacterium sp. MCSS17_007]WIE74371.1 4'-phosphopantetheinyl transferase superfamily protein [Curtobacterium sp. MCSS17_007]
MDLPTRAVLVTVVPPGADREALLAAVARVAAVDVDAVRAGRECPHCGSTGHGRPWATAAGAAVAVSTARCPGQAAVAVVSGPGRTDDRLGIDLEQVARVAAASLDAFGPRERRRLRDDRDRTAAWAVKEAVLKRDGRGLRVDPRAVEVDLRRSVARLEGREEPVTVVWTASGTVLAVASGGLPVVVEDRVSASAS